MAGNVINIGRQRLRSLGEARLISNPLARQARVVSRLTQPAPSRKSAGPAVWTAALICVAALFALGG